MLTEGTRNSVIDVLAEKITQNATLEQVTVAPEFGSRQDVAQPLQLGLYGAQ